MSTHEAIDRMLQYNGQLYKVSEKFLFVPTTFPRYRTRCLKKIEELEQQDETDTKIFSPDFIHDFYPRRPETPYFDEISLHNYVKNYERTYNKKIPQEFVIEIKDEDGQNIIARLKERTEKNRPIIQHYEFDAKKNPESFYYSFLCLYKPWRQDSDILGSSSTYKEEFFRVLESLPEMKDRYERRSTMKRMREEMEERADEEAANDDHTTAEDDNLADNMDDNNPVIGQALQDFENINNSSAIKTEEELARFVSTLNSDQQRVYAKITSSLLHSIDHKEGNCKCAVNKPLMMYVSGFGGTGKTYLIKALVGFMFVQRNVHNRSCDNILGAPTGLAADNIKGQTLHSAFNLPVEHGDHPKYASLSKQTLTQTRAVMKDLECVIIDEVSMVSNVILLLVHMRLCEIFNQKSPFGNKSIILFGDLLQLDPVQAQSPYQEISGNLMNKITDGNKVSLNLWHEFQFDELTINQRQTGDANAAWKSLLYRVRTGTHTIEDIKVLTDRCIDIPQSAGSPDEKLDAIINYFIQLSQSGQTPVCLLPTREMVDRFNVAVLKKLHPHAEEVLAVDYIDCRNKRNIKAAEKAVKRLDHLDDPRNTAGLEKKIPISDGVKVMLRSNIDTARGLVNGSIGTVTGAERDPNTGKITCVKVLFNGMSEPVSIKPVKRKIQIFPGAFLHREQFPLCSSYAMTIHKSQGLTLSSALIDLGHSIFAPSQTYVAISRVSSLDGLHLINFDPKKVIVNTASLEEYVRLGSKSGISTADRRSVRKENINKLKSFTLTAERVWYISSSRKKAKTTIDATIFSAAKKTGNDKSKPKQKDQKATRGTDTERNRGPQKDPKPKFHVPKSSATGDKNKTNIPPGKGKKLKIHAIMPAFIHIPVVVTDSVNEIIRLASTCPDSGVLLNLISEQSMETTYFSAIIPYCDRQSDDLQRRIATELQPDPFGIANSTRQKWLSSDVMNIYGMYLRDLSTTLAGAPSVYFVASYARYYFKHRPQNYVTEYIRSTHTAQQYSEFLSDEYVHSFQNAIDFAGDPLARDIIINFCNDSTEGHWYLLILDQRAGRNKSVTMYDSGWGSSEHVLGERCAYLVDFINNFRSHVTSSYPETIHWPQRKLRVRDFQFKDGKSQQQRNGFDCGVFSLLNAESYIRSWDHKIWRQNALPLFRIRAIWNIKAFSILTNMLL